MSDNDGKPREIPLCEFCNNTGVHLCPDVAEPILISCSKKGCRVTELLGVEKKLAEAEAECGETHARLHGYNERISALEQKLKAAEDEVQDLREVYYDFVDKLKASGTEDVRMNLDQHLELHNELLDHAKRLAGALEWLQKRFCKPDIECADSEHHSYPCVDASEALKAYKEFIGKGGG